METSKKIIPNPPDSFSVPNILFSAMGSLKFASYTARNCSPLMFLTCGHQLKNPGLRFGRQLATIETHV
jgi:hypothetical protein